MFKPKGVMFLTLVIMLIAFNCSRLESDQPLLIAEAPLHLDEEHIDDARIEGSEVGEDRQEMVDVGDHKLQIVRSGHGSPTVVFESGLGDTEIERCGAFCIRSCFKLRRTACTSLPTEPDTQFISMTRISSSTPFIG